MIFSGLNQMFAILLVPNKRTIMTLIIFTFHLLHTLSATEIKAAPTTEGISVETEEITPDKSYTGRNQKQIEKIFKKHEIIPDFIDETPQYELNVRYAGGIWPDFGTKHLPEELKFEPFAVRFPTIPHVMYSLFMLDLDSPSRENATKRSYYHWGLANIPGHDFLYGETLAKYIGPFPEKGTGLHRYVFLVYKQPFLSYMNYKVSYTEPRLLPIRDDTNRANWNLREIVKKYKLEGPVAGNFLYCEWTSPS